VSFLPDLWKFGIWGEPCDGKPYSGVGELTVAQGIGMQQLAKYRFLLSMGLASFFRTGCNLNTSGSRRCGDSLWGMVSGRVLLTNAHSCLVPNQTAIQYECMPPSLQEYFHD